MQTTLLSIAIALILALLAALGGPHVIRWNDHRTFFEAEASRLVVCPVADAVPDPMHLQPTGEGARPPGVPVQDLHGAGRIHWAKTSGDYIVLS